MDELNKPQEQEKELTEEAQKEIWAKEMEENEAIQRYFSRFHPSSVENFKEYYLARKSWWVKTHPSYKEEMQNDGFKWVDSAFERLKTIQQKKLFNVQCLWRAGQLSIKEIDICHDFGIWEEDILNCPFIEPVSRSDIDMYCLFLEDMENEEAEYCSWQNYKELKLAYNDDPEAQEEYPDWYAFYDIRKGTNTLMLLPDIKGEKEEFYIEISRENITEEERAKRDADNEERERNRDKREYLSYYGDDVIAWFVKTFESEEIREYYDAYSYALRNYPKKEDLQPQLDLLFEAEEMVPIEANKNWMEGIRIAAERYQRRKITEAMPAAWEQYQMNIDMGIGFPRKDRIKTDDFLSKYFRKRIIEGRILNGEPGDFNF